MFNGFKTFIMRGNVIDLAVAVAVGAAFTAVVSALVENILNPLIGAIFQVESLNEALVLSIPTLNGGTADIRFGAVIAAIISFLLVALVIYFAVVLPMNTLKARAEARRATGEPEPDDPETELSVLTEIRALLADQRGTTPSSDSGKHSA